MFVLMGIGDQSKPVLFINWWGESIFLLFYFNAKTGRASKVKITVWLVITNKSDYTIDLISKTSNGTLWVDLPIDHVGIESRNQMEVESVHPVIGMSAEWSTVLGKEGLMNKMVIVLGLVLSCCWPRCSTFTTSVDPDGLIYMWDGAIEFLHQVTGPNGSRSDSSGPLERMEHQRESAGLRRDLPEDDFWNSS